MWTRTDLSDRAEIDFDEYTVENNYRSPAFTTPILVIFLPIFVEYQIFI